MNKSCFSCGLPLSGEDGKDFRGNFCQYCSNEEGKLHPRELIQNGIAEWLKQWAPGDSSVDFMKRAANYMKAMFGSIKHIIVLALLFLSSCNQNQPEITDSDRIEIENAINHVFSEIMKATEQLDLDKMFSFILDNNKGVLTRNGQLILTRQEALDI